MKYIKKYEKIELILEKSDFQEWFEGSVVTDTGKVGGLPLAVYHGTDSEFHKFSELHSHVFFFTKDEKIAKKFSRTSNVRKYYLQMRNPFIIPFENIIFK